LAVDEPINYPITQLSNYSIERDCPRQYRATIPKYGPFTVNAPVSSSNL